MLHSQGASRFSSEEIATFRLDIWQNINALLVDSRKDQEKSDEPFWVLGGAGPSEADAALFGSITASLVTNAYVLQRRLVGGLKLTIFDRSPKATATVKSFPAVMNYATRIHNRSFPDFEMWK